jgi:hypothetical protein
MLNLSLVSISNHKVRVVSIARIFKRLVPAEMHIPRCSLNWHAASTVPFALAMTRY